jgi:sugar lactone lactonase YvrE
MIAELTWEVIAPAGAELGERPVWDPNRNCLIWVDITTGNLHRLGPDRKSAILGSHGLPVGAAAPRAGGGYVLARPTDSG